MTFQQVLRPPHDVRDTDMPPSIEHNNSTIGLLQAIANKLDQLLAANPRQEKPAPAFIDLSPLNPITAATAGRVYQTTVRLRAQFLFIWDVLDSGYLLKIGESIKFTLPAGNANPPAPQPIVLPLPITIERGASIQLVALNSNPWSAYLIAYPE